MRSHEARRAYAEMAPDLDAEHAAEIERQIEAAKQREKAES